MAVIIALLRNINVGGKTVKMDKLRSLFECMRLTCVRTVIQSGNVLFDADRTPDDMLHKQIEETLRAALGFDVPVILLSQDELTAILTRNPFAKLTLNGNERVHVTVLRDVPGTEAADRLTPDPRSEDVFRLIGRAAYILCKNGYNNTPYSNSFFERKLKTAATTRNFETMEKLAVISNSRATV